MGMDVNNSRLSGLDQMAQATLEQQGPLAQQGQPEPRAQQGQPGPRALKSDQAQHADKSKSVPQGLVDTPDAADVNMFEKSLKGAFTEKAMESKLPSAENLFAGIFGAQQQAAGQPQMTASATPSPEALGGGEAPDAMNTMVNKMVDRILVSEPGKGQQEVRLTFNDAALKGTEVTLTRATDGQLMVKLNTTDASSYQTLVGAQDSLRTALERNGQNVRVEASLSSEQQDNDSNQRSRTYQAYNPDEA